MGLRCLGRLHDPLLRLLRRRWRALEAGLRAGQALRPAVRRAYIRRLCRLCLLPGHSAVDGQPERLSPGDNKDRPARLAADRGAWRNSALHPRQRVRQQHRRDALAACRVPDVSAAVLLAPGAREHWCVMVCQDAAEEIPPDGYATGAAVSTDAAGGSSAGVIELTRGDRPM